MRAMDATVLMLAVVGLACRRPGRARTPADAGTVVTVYVTPKAVDRLMVG